MATTSVSGTRPPTALCVACILLRVTAFSRSTIMTETYHNQERLHNHLSFDKAPGDTNSTLSRGENGRAQIRHFLISSAAWVPAAFMTLMSGIFGRQCLLQFSASPLARSVSAHLLTPSPVLSLFTVFTARVPKWECTTPGGCKVGHPPCSQSQSQSHSHSHFHLFFVCLCARVCVNILPLTRITLDSGPTTYVPFLCLIRLLREYSHSTHPLFVVLVLGVPNPS